MKKILKNLIALRDQTFRIRKVRRNGTSFVVTLLPSFVRENGLTKKGSKVSMELKSNSLIIVPIVPEETTIEHLNLSEERK